MSLFFLPGWCEALLEEAEWAFAPLGLLGHCTLFDPTKLSKNLHYQRFLEVESGTQGVAWYGAVAVWGRGIPTLPLIRS